MTMRRKAQAVVIRPQQMGEGGDDLMQGFMDALGGGMPAQPVMDAPLLDAPDQSPFGDMGEMMQAAEAESLEMQGNDALGQGIGLLEQAISLFDEYEAVEDDGDSANSGDSKENKQFDKLKETVDKLKDICDKLCEAEIEEFEIKEEEAAKAGGSDASQGSESSDSSSQSSGSKASDGGDSSEGSKGSDTLEGREANVRGFTRTASHNEGYMSDLFTLK